MHPPGNRLKLSSMHAIFLQTSDFHFQIWPQFVTRKWALSNNSKTLQPSRKLILFNNIYLIRVVISLRPMQCTKKSKTRTLVVNPTLHLFTIDHFWLWKFKTSIARNYWSKDYDWLLKIKIQFRCNNFWKRIWMEKLSSYPGQACKVCRGNLSQHFQRIQSTFSSL